MEGPVVLCGDFNHWYFTRDRKIKRSGFLDVAETLEKREDKFPSGGPFFRLDRVYVNEYVRPLDLRVHRSVLSGRASDHLPLVCRLEVRRAPS